MAGNLLLSISKDERERAIYRSRRMYQTDQGSNIATAEERGRRAGITVGRAERDIVVVRNMLKLNMPVSQIAMVTELPHERIVELAERMQSK